jgi:hypothetical protein
MNGADWAQVAAALFTALAAMAALRTVRHVRAQTETARAALDAQTQPLLAAVPYGLYTRRGGGKVPLTHDRADVSVGTWTGSRGQPELAVLVPVRNVGNGAAYIRTVRFRVEAGFVPGNAETVILPPGELTRVAFVAPEDSEDWNAAAEAIAIELQDFEVDIEYDDVTRRPRGVVTLRIANGQNPRVRDLSLGN